MLIFFNKNYISRIFLLNLYSRVSLLADWSIEEAEKSGFAKGYSLKFERMSQLTETITCKSWEGLLDGQRSNLCDGVMHFKRIPTAI